MVGPERRSHFRGKPRPGRRVQVVYRAGERQAQNACTSNIGIGGAFIESEETLPVGTPIALWVTLPTSPEPIELKGEIRWAGPAARDAAGRQGIGVKFHGVEIEALLELHRYFASLTGAETAAEAR